MCWSSAEPLVWTSATMMKMEHGQFCWTNLWNGIKTNRCPRTVCIAARESLLPRLRHPLAINCCLYRSACCFSCTVSLLQGCFGVCYWMGLSACCVALFSWRLLCSPFHTTDWWIGQRPHCDYVYIAVSILYMCIKWKASPRDYFCENVL